MEVLVETTTGKLAGQQLSEHQSFLGIPFAQPPVGALRFRPPQAPARWSGLRRATEFGSAAIQGTHAIPGMAASGPRNEDCLYLNVFTPCADASRRPVLFWIHGGGFRHGSGSEPLYSGGPLAERGDVVVVTINYRLGALGYLHLGEHGGDRWGASANLGQLDQIAALSWVRDNIASFGGDTENVTLFGESAGAASVATLLAMPAARGLFRRAVPQSGTGNLVGNRETGARVASAFLARLGLESADAAKLQELPVETILETQLELDGESDGLSFTPICDEATLPERPLDLVRAGGSSEIDLMIGTNRDEIKLFTAMRRNRPAPDDAELLTGVRASLPRRSRERAAEVIETYRSARQGLLSISNVDLLDAIQTDARFRIPCIRLAEAQREYQPRTYLYLFCWESPARRGLLGSCHALELPFVFGTLDAPMQDRFAGSSPAAERLSRNMMDAWIAFARNGEPSHDGIGDWSAYDRSSRRSMVFDAESELVAAPFERERAVWDEIIR